MSRRYGRAGWSVAAAVIACLAVGLADTEPAKVSAAPSAAELRERVAEAKAEAGRLRAQLSAARQRMFAAEAEAEDAQAELDLVERRLALGRQRTAALAERVEQASTRLRAERGRLARARRNLADRLVAIYIAGPAGADEVAVGAADFDEFLVGAQYMAAIQNADGRLAERVEEVRESVAARLAVLKRERAAAARHEAMLAADRDRVGAVQRAAAARADSLRQAASERDAALAELTAKMGQWTKQVEQAERREARQAAGHAAAADEVERWLGGPYSIPTAIVMCESGGNYSALNPSSGAGGAYQIMPATWAAYGGKGLPHEASKAEQDRIAALIWADSGPAAWVCKG